MSEISCHVLKIRSRLYVFFYVCVINELGSMNTNWKLVELQVIYYKHFAWLMMSNIRPSRTLRYLLILKRETRSWSNVLEYGRIILFQNS